MAVDDFDIGVDIEHCYLGRFCFFVTHTRAECNKQYNLFLVRESLLLFKNIKLQQ